MSARADERLKAACITVLGSGHLRPAPGTWGSLVAVLVFAALWWLGASLLGSRWAIEAVLVLGILTSAALSVRWGEWAIERYNRKDPQEFVLDEFAGQWVALLALPMGLEAGVWTLTCALGGQFLLFRILDIVKPPPARRCERLRGGWGILMDDLFAGAYANIVGQVLWRLTPLAAWLGPGTGMS